MDTPTLAYKMGMCRSPGYGFQGTPDSIDVGKAYTSVISPPFYSGGQGGKWVKMNKFTTVLTLLMG